MSRMVPALPRPTNSPGEPDVFVRLRDDPVTKTWIVLHSLDVANHRSQISGEIDFLVIIPNRGVLIIEVKACSSLRREDGLWYLGNVPGESRGPFRQASEAMHSLRGRLARERPHLSRVPFWSCVIFPRMEFQENSVEWHSWQVIDCSALRASPLGRLLREVMDRARAYLASSGGASWFHADAREPYDEQCEELLQFFRRDFECYASYKTRSASIAAETKAYTDEQLVALDAMDTNPRVVFTGPAGTGKTVLATEAARRAALSSRRVLLLCYNRLLASSLARQCQSVAPNVHARTLHAHMLEVARLDPSAIGTDEEFWQSELPGRAIDSMLGREEAEYLFDEIVVDEAQDIFRNEYLDFLDLSLLGGLSAGRWRFFGDFEKQAIFGSANLALPSFFARLAERPAEYSLRINCRNPPSVAALAQMLGGLAPGYSRVLRPHDGTEPQMLFFDDHADQVRLLEKTLEKLFSEGLSGSDIVILSPRADDLATAGMLKEQSWKQRVRTFGSGSGGYIRYCSIQAFKGLEAPAIVVSDLDSADRAFFESLIYIAVTRSVHRLVLLMHKSLRAILTIPKSI
jgi:hypothetical protein